MTTPTARLPQWFHRFKAEHGIWPIAGGSGEGESHTETDEDPGEGGEPGTDPSGGEGGPPAASEETVPREEHEKVVKRMKAADRRADDNAKEADALREELAATRVELAVRREAAEREEPFADLGIVLQVLDLDEIATDDDGEPVEVGEALDRLADRHPYLLAEEEVERDRIDPRDHISSGTSMNKDRNSGAGYDKKKLMEKYPVLRHRRG